MEKKSLLLKNIRIRVDGSSLVLKVFLEIFFPRERERAALRKARDNSPATKALLGELVFHASPHEKRALLKTPAWEATPPVAVTQPRSE